MNGLFKDLFATTHTYGSKSKKRTLEEQKFDNVFHGLPYDDVENCPATVDNKAVGNAICCNTRKDLSGCEIEKSAKALYVTKDLEWNNLALAQGSVKSLLNDAWGENGLASKSRVLGNFRPQGVSENREDQPEENFGSPTKENKSASVPNIKCKRNRGNIQKKLKKSNSKRRPLNRLLDRNNISGSGTCRRELQETSSINTNFDLSAYLLRSKAKRQSSPETLDIQTGIVNLFPTSPLKKAKLSSMMTDYQEENLYHQVTNGDITPDCDVATLLNMGNTCFLNSVLYALRFTPTFLHNLHHLVVDSCLVSNKLKENKTKTSSLGRNGSAVSGSSWRSASSKDLLSIGSNDVVPKSKDQIVTEKLHALFVTMNNLEMKCSPDPYQPEALLQAMRDANPLYEGNHQQDAHEFFVELLSCLRVTCDKLNEQIEQYPDLIKPPGPTSANVNNNNKLWGVRRSWKKQLRKKEKSSCKKNGDIESDVATGDSEDNLSVDSSGDSMKKKFGYNFVSEDFQGVSLHRTKCLECEEVSELKEPFLEIQVPVNYREEDFDPCMAESSIFGAICVTSEKLCDQNKYFCENCNKYNEALRTVLYEKLPNIMVLHLKRFSTTLSGAQKVNAYVPTPLEIRCFCESCSKIEKAKITPHKYRLSCVIMHLGASIASGHYIAYSRASLETYDYIKCTRDVPKSSKELSAYILKFFKAKALGNSLSETPNGIGTNSKKNDAQVCQSINCCGIRCKLNLGSPSHNDDWLEFDDEKVKLLSNKEFMDMLNRRHDSTNTPYLLFYSKV